MMGMTQRPRPLWQSIVGLVLVILLLLAAGLAVLLYQARRASVWPPYPPGVALAPSRPLLARDAITSNNAFFFMLAATNSRVRVDHVEWQAFLTNSWTAGAFTNLESALAAAAPQLALLDQMAALADGQVESLTNLAQFCPYVTTHLSLSKLQAYEMGRAFAQGRPDDALAAARRALAVNAHMEKGAALIGRLVVIACDQAILQQLARALNRGQLPIDRLRPAAALLARRCASLEPWAEAVRYEALCSLDGVRMVYAGEVRRMVSLTSVEPAREHLLRYSLPLLRPLGSNPERTRGHLEAVYAHLIARADNPWRLKEYERTAPVLQELDIQVRQVWLDDPVGRVLTALLVPSLSAACHRQFSNVASLRALQLALLVEAFRRERGDGPETLDALWPDFAPVELRDPFLPAGSLLYRRDGDRFTIYSVGPNGLDDGGQVEPTDANHSHPPDVGWQIGSAENAEFRMPNAECRIDRPLYSAGTMQMTHE
jgi:hypothetical protein